MKKSGVRRGVLVYKGPDPAGKIEIPVNKLTMPPAMLNALVDAEPRLSLSRLCQRPVRSAPPRSAYIP